MEQFAGDRALQSSARWDYLPSDGKEAAIVSDAPRLEVLTREVMKKLHVSWEAHNLLRFPGRRFDS